MLDTTVSGALHGRESRAIPRGGTLSWTDSHVQNDDEAVARLLITSWALATNRTLRMDVSPQLLSTDELISFWADDQMTADQATPASHVSRAESR